MDPAFIANLKIARDNALARYTELTSDPQSYVKYIINNETREFLIEVARKAMYDTQESYIKEQQRQPALFRLNRISR